ncbi:Uncharacterised protein [Bordetella pertussis]|nr:Uncharacterised protein [Bordetella pertussis]
MAARFLGCWLTEPSQLEAASVAAEPALRHLADARALACDDPRCARLSDEARSCLADWLDAGWLRYQP